MRHATGTGIGCRLVGRLGAEQQWELMVSIHKVAGRIEASRQHGSCMCPMLTTALINPSRLVIFTTKRTCAYVGLWSLRNGSWWATCARKILPLPAPCHFVAYRDHHLFLPHYATCRAFPELSGMCVHWASYLCLNSRLYRLGNCQRSPFYFPNTWDLQYRAKRGRVGSQVHVGFLILIFMQAQEHQ